MRILLVGQNYAPEPTSVGPFTTGLAEHLARTGNNVSVATTFPHYPQWQWQDGSKRLRLIETISAVEVRRWRVILPPKPSSAAWRVLFDMSVGFSMLLNSIRVQTPDLLICVSPPIETAFVGLLYAALRHRPFVILVKDMPVQLALAVGMLKPGPIARTALAFEGFMYRRASRIVTISGRFADSLLKLGVSQSVIVQIPDWVDTDYIRPQAPSTSMRQHLGASDGDFLTLHAGQMGAKQALQHVIDSTAALTNPKLQFALVGDGPQRPGLQADIARRSLRHIRVLPLVSEQDLPALLSAADVLLVSQRAQVRDSVLPSKTLSYMAANRPIIAAVADRSATAELVRAADCGIVIPPEDSQALAVAVERLSRDPDLCERMGNNGRRYAIDHFSKLVILRQWDALIADIAQPQSR